MKFKLTTTGRFYSCEDAEKLEKFGMTFENWDTFKDRPRHQSRTGEIEIGSLEDLIAFAKEWGDLIIISHDNQPEIEIYDDYRE